MSIRFNNEFGRSVAPVRFSAEEEKFAPNTMFVLDESTAARITNWINFSALDSGSFPTFPFRDFTILWVVTAEGRIIIAIEEGLVVTGDGEQNQSVKSFPLPNAIRGSYPKLGHPSLVACQPARIGGEIICDLEDRPCRWYITNRSGRYGLNLGRTQQHLANAALEFARFGIQLNTEFM